MIRRTTLLVLLVIVLAAACRDKDAPPAGGDPAASPKVRGVVLVTIENVRPDRLESNGGSDPSPSFSLLAASGVIFNDVTSTVPMARPAAASILTGRGADRTGVRDNHLDRLPDGVTLLQEAYAKAGFSTAAFVGSGFLPLGSGFERGFAVADLPESTLFGLQRHFPRARRATDVAANFVTWLNGLRADEPYFAMVHFGDLHGHAESLDTIDLAAYTKGWATVDTALGSIADAIAARGAAAGPVEIVVVGTHGVYLGEDGRRGDAYWLTPETLKVPLVWSGGRAASAAGTRRSDRVWLPDVGATLASAVGVSLGEDGADLFGASVPEDRARHAWSWAPDDEMAWPTLSGTERQGAWTVVETSIGGTVPERGAAPRFGELSQAAASALQAIGVVGAAPRSAARPKDADALLGDFQKARALSSAGRFRLARNVLKAIEQRQPGLYGVALDRLLIAQSIGPKGEPDSLAADLLQKFPGRRETYHWAAHSDLIARRPERAGALLEAAMAIGPSDADTLYDVACVKSIAGDKAAAVESLRGSIRAGYRNWDWIEKDPDLQSLHGDPGFVEILRTRGR